MKGIIEKYNYKTIKETDAKKIIEKIILNLKSKNSE